MEVIPNWITPLTPAAFRGVMGHLATAVCVVTAFDESNQPRGMTMTSLCRVADEPPLLLVSMTLKTATLEAVRHSGGFTVNLLAPGDENVAQTFATSRADKFAAVGWSRPAQRRGGPVLEGRGHLVCGVERLIVMGDHCSVIGRVLGAAVPQAIAPMVYFRRGFGTFRKVADSSVRTGSAA